MQTPQYFRSTKDQTWVERARRRNTRSVLPGLQVSRDRFGSALCVGSNAIYRRGALGRSPRIHQHPIRGRFAHRPRHALRGVMSLSTFPWCSPLGCVHPPLIPICGSSTDGAAGALSLIWTHHMWRVPMPWRVSVSPPSPGGLWNLTSGLRTLILPLIPITLLAFLPAEVQLRNAILLIPVVVTGTIVYPLWHNVRWTANVWPLAIAVGWAQAPPYGITGGARSCPGIHLAVRRTPACDFVRLSAFGTEASPILWIALVVWRIEQTLAPRFVVVALFGLVNLASVARVVFPGRYAK